VFFVVVTNAAARLALPCGRYKCSELGSGLRACPICVSCIPLMVRKGTESGNQTATSNLKIQAYVYNVADERTKQSGDSRYRATVRGTNSCSRQQVGAARLVAAAASAINIPPPQHDDSDRSS
jgi:hypothetical protein